MISALRICRVAIPATGVLVLLLGGCAAAEDEDEEEDYSIRSTVTGLTASGLVLQYNGAGSIPVSAGATTVSITDEAVPDSAYAVTILTQPAGQVCSVANGSGTATADVHNIAITCSAAYLIGGTISGLTGTGLTLLLNGQTTAPFVATPSSGQTTFQFAAGLASAATYSVGVAIQPANPAQACSITGGNGTVPSANVTNVTVTCANSAPFKVGGPVVGLTGTGLSLRMYYTGGPAPAVVNVAAADSTYAFAESVPAGGGFLVGIVTQPANQSCVVVRGRGANAPADITNVDVTCVANTPSTLAGTYDVLTPAGRLYLNFNADGTFTNVLTLKDPGCNTATDTGEGNGVEYGVFAWNSASGALTLPRGPAIDTSGECGFADSGVAKPAMFVTKGAGTISFQETGGSPTVLTAIAPSNPATSVVGAYVAEAANGQLLVLHADNTFMVAETQARGGARINTHERGCYAVSSAQITFTINTSCRPDNLDSFDFNGPGGLGGFPAVPTIGPLSFALEGSTVLVLNGFRWRRSVAN